MSVHGGLTLFLSDCASSFTAKGQKMKVWLVHYYWAQALLWICPSRWHKLQEDVQQMINLLYLSEGSWFYQPEQWWLQWGEQSERPGSHSWGLSIQQAPRLEKGFVRLCGFKHVSHWNGWLCGNFHNEKSLQRGKEKLTFTVKIHFIIRFTITFKTD